MKVEIDMKITFLEGEQKGRIITDKKIVDTESEVTEIGIIERLRLEWNYIHQMKSVKQVMAEVEDKAESEDDNV